MTMNTYGQVILAAKRKAMEAVGDLFEGPGGRSETTVMGRFRPRSQFAAAETRNPQVRSGTCLRFH